MITEDRLLKFVARKGWCLSTDVYLEMADLRSVVDRSTFCK